MNGRCFAALAALAASGCGSDPVRVEQAPVTLAGSPAEVFANRGSIAVAAVMDDGVAREVTLSSEAQVSLRAYAATVSRAAQPAGARALTAGARVTLDVHTLLFAAVAVLIGFQAVSFAALSKFFAIRAGLRRPETGFDDWFRHVTLESGLILGGVLVLAGLALSIGAVGIWGGRDFGQLQPGQTLRWVIPGALCLVLGCQMILTSCFLGVLRLDTRDEVS